MNLDYGLKKHNIMKDVKDFSKKYTKKKLF